MKKSPTIRDVAARAGVSIATVSRVINGRGHTSAHAERAVRCAVREIGFRPNAIGQRLKTARSRTVGVLVPSLGNPIFADVVQGIERAAEAAGYSVLLTSSNYLSAREASAVELLLSNRVEGLILTVSDEASSPALALLRRERVPFVLAFNPAIHPDQSTVTVDNRRAARELVERLVALGHRRIAMVAGTFQASDRSGLRRAGYEDALRRHGLKPGPVIEVAFDTLDLLDLCARTLTGRWPPTALFCSTDMLAIAAIRSLIKLGLRIPDDISVVGFDGIGAGEWMTPSVATIVQPAEEMGGRAFQHLLDRIHEQVPPMHVTLPHRVRPGESWGPPPKSSDARVSSGATFPPRHRHKQPAEQA